MLKTTYKNNRVRLGDTLFRGVLALFEQRFKVLDDIEDAIFNSINIIILHRIIIMKTLVFPIVATSAILIFQPDKPSFTEMILITLTEWFIYTMLAVTIHRIILLGPESVSNWGLNIPGTRELNFFYHSFLIGVLIIPAAITAFIPNIGIFIAAFLMAYIISRLSLVFPSIATDKPVSISESWSATSNHQILMIIVVVIFPVIFSLPELIISIILNGSLALILVNIVSLITLIFIVAALSECYKLEEKPFIES